MKWGRSGSEWVGCRLVIDSSGIDSESGIDSVLSGFRIGIDSAPPFSPLESESDSTPLVLEQNRRRLHYHFADSNTIPISNTM